MWFSDKREVISQMNEYGSNLRPFFFIIDYKQERIYLSEPDAVSPEEVLYCISDFSNISRTPTGCYPGHPVWNVFPQSIDQYNTSYRKVREAILAGNSYLVNLTCSTPIETDLTLKDIFTWSQAPYKVWLKDAFVCFSPETFVRLRDGYIYSYPMKGTRDASVPGAKEELLNDPKESAEHATITDLIRNDLSRVAEEVEVTRYRYIDEVITHRGKLFQMSSEIRGTLPKSWKERIGDILFSLLPAGSITGAPKKKTMQIIAGAETAPRGFYTGITGYFDGEKLDSAVMIRFIRQEGNKFYYHSGGGITSQSCMEDEYNEMKQKIYVPFC